MKKVLFINGPNLNLLGKRENEVYGNETLQSINERIEAKAKDMGIETTFFQSNSEGEIIDRIHKSPGLYDCIILNPGAYTHYSIAIRDAIKAVDVPVIEVHISNIYSREEFRTKSVTAPVCRGLISGFGADVYLLALHAADMII